MRPPQTLPAERSTISDLARRSDVAPGTASRVPNNRNRLNPETPARGQEAAQHVGLRQHAAERVRQVERGNAP